MTPLSLHAQRALERLNESASLNWSIRSDAARNDANCSGPNPPNIRFNQSLEYYLGSQQVVHAADTLNSYCQSILAEILTHAPHLWDTVKPVLDTSKTREKYIEILKNHRGTDGRVRNALRDGVQCYWSPESDVVAKLRNKFVHQNGHDLDREIEQEILSKNGQWCDIPPEELINQPIPVRYGADNWLEADAALGNWACLHIRNHIHLMDQNVCHVHNLPRERWRPRPVSRQIASVVNLYKAVGIAPGQPLTTMDKIVSKPEKSKDDWPKAKEEDVMCSKVWKEWQDVVLKSVESYIEQLNLHQTAQRAGIVGSVLPHTLAGQERHFEWSLLPPDPHEHRNPETVCIRLRENKLKPFLTVWGKSSVLRDFQEGQEDAALEYLKDCIDKTLTTVG